MRKLLLLTLLPIISFAQSKSKVDMLIQNATIYTVDSSWHIYQAMAVNDGSIIAIGSNKEINSRYTSTNNINATGKFIYPGFIDAHCHFSGYALDKYKCALEDTRSFQQVIQKLVAYEKTNELSWIYGRGWDQNKWPVKEFPTKDTLDKLFPDKPVILKRIDGHAILCNEKALEMAHITVHTTIEGGQIIKKNGQLTGVLIDNAMEPVENLIPALPAAQAEKYLQAAQNDCYSFGLTYVIDCGVKKDVINLLRHLYAQNKLSIGNALLLADDEVTFGAFVKQGPVDYGQLKIAGIKMYADGALGSRGASLIDDYTDMPGHRGTLLSPIAHFKDIAALALQYHWQLCTHAIGDNANRQILNVYAEALNGKNDLRWRIEHCQVVDPTDMHLFGDNSIIPSVQPTHATSDMPWAINRLGAARLPHAYAFKDLLNQNGWEALGTDFPVEGISPIHTFYAAVFRQDAKGYSPGGFLSKNALTRKEALQGMTLWAAKSIFSEKQKGSLEKGKDADFVILDTDIMKAPQQKILKTKVLYTIVKGKIVYQYKKQTH